MTKPDLSDRILKWVAVIGAIGGLGFGGFILEARHSVQVSEIKELIQSENRAYMDTVTSQVTENIKDHLSEFKASITVDHNRLMESNYKKDSLLLIVLPRVLQQVKESTQNTKQLKAMVDSQNSTKMQPIWEYIILKERQDSIMNRDNEIMRELRSINKQLMVRPKMGDRAK